MTPLLESIHFHYATRILPTIEQSTHHIHITDISLPELQESINALLCQPLWKELCPSHTNATSCHIIPVMEMNELYFSHPEYAKQRRYLYGASANFEEHTDSVFRFPSANLYRVLIGLSDGNNHTETYFPAWEKGAFLNRGDYLAFDFDRTRHIVRRRSSLPPSSPSLSPSLSPSPSRPRYLLKFHFLVYDPSLYSPSGLHYITRLYVYYDYITRWMLMIGTDPMTYYEYVMGWFIQLYIAPYVAHTVVGVICGTFLMLRYLSYSMTVSLAYSFLSPIASLLGLALGDWMADLIHKE